MHSHVRGKAKTMNTLFSKALAATLLVAMSGFALAAEPANKPSTRPPAAKPPSARTPETKPEAKPEVKSETNAPGGVLKVGSDAPGLHVNKWIKGQEVSSFEKGKSYVVEFWATWCPPCRESIPHLTSLAKQYKDVTFIGVAGSERGSDDAPKLQKLEKFVKDQGTKMSYSVAFDAKGATVKAFMDAAGQEGIPCAFVIDGDGKISFIGHPMDEGFEQAIAKVSKGGTKSNEQDKEEKQKDKKKKARAGGG
jgi:thiol-disulfide isomerase/thioredoxin